MSLMHPVQRREALEIAYGPWMARTLAQHLDLVAERFADAPFVVTDDATFTYAHIRDWSERLANGLIEIGVQPGENVAMVMANYPEFVALKFAIASIGATCVPINFLLRERELTYVLRQSNAVALVTMDRFRDMAYVEMLDSMMPDWERSGGGASFAKLRNVIVFSPEGRSRNWRSLASLEDTNPDGVERLHVTKAAGDPNSNSDILYTSGTTGSPKGVLLTHDMVVRTAYASAFGRALPVGHRMTYSMPMYHVFGYIECLLAASFVGGAVVPRVVFDAKDMLAGVAKHRVNEIICVPTMTLGLLSEARSTPYDLSSITIMYSSGGPAPTTIWDEIREVFQPAELATGYGQTETTAAATATLPELSDDYVRTTNGRFRMAGVAGDPTLGGALAVYKTVDIATGADLPPGQRGELLVRGPMVTSGYYEKPEETAATITADGWLRTGDVGIVDTDNYVTLIGRVKETYRCGGEMVMPKEVETILAEHPDVAQAHVVGIPDARMGEVGCAFIVATDGTNPPREQELIDLCARELARFKVPRHVLYIAPDELPLTVTQRVQKFRLVEIAQRRLAATSSASA